MDRSRDMPYFSNKQDDALLMNSLDIENLEKYLNIKEDYAVVNKSKAITDQFENEKPSYYLPAPTKERFREKEFRERLQSSLHLLSRMGSPEADKFMQSLRIHLGEENLSGQFDDEIIDSLLDQPNQENEEAFFAEIERVLKSLEKNPPDQDFDPGFVTHLQYENEQREAEIQNKRTSSLHTQKPTPHPETKENKKLQNNQMEIHQNDEVSNNNTARTTALSNRPSMNTISQPLSTKPQRKKLACQIF